MLRPIVGGSLALLSLLPFATAQSATVRAHLEPHFRAAVADAAGVVPLILEGSTALGSLEPPEARLLADTLERYSARAFFSPERLPGEQRLGIATHVVRSGEIGSRIAQRYRIGPGLLRYLNRDYDADRLRVGQELKVVDLSDKSLRIVVETSRYRLSLFRDRPQGGGTILVASFPVGLGAGETPTPVGRTTITKRVLDPQWTHPVTKQVFEAGDPGNVLGGYWIALDAAGIGRSGIGLHGYTGEVAANWIEQPASHGCVRMLQPHVDRVFHIAVEGTPVEIR